LFSSVLTCIMGAGVVMCAGGRESLASEINHGLKATVKSNSHLPRGPPAPLS
jgi:hypothetical protein